MPAGSSGGEVIRWPDGGGGRDPGERLRRRGLHTGTDARIVPLPRAGEGPAPRWTAGLALLLALVGACVLAIGLWILVG